MNRISGILRSREAKNTGWLVGGRIIQMALSLVIGVITARFLGPANYGLINYGAAFVTFFNSLCTLGLNSVIVKNFVDHPDDQGTTIGTSLVLRLISSITSAAMIIGIAMLLDGDEPMTVAVVALCSLGAVFHIFETFNYWFQYKYKSKVTSIATLSAYAVTAGYRIVLLVLGKDVRWFAFASSVDYIAAAVLLFAAYKKHGGMPLRFSTAKAKQLLSVSYNYILSSAMAGIYAQTDKLMLKQMMNESEVGFYSTAIAICGMWTFVLQAVIDSVYPTILRLRNENYELYIRRNRQLYAAVFYVSCMVSLGFVLLGDLVVEILYGQQYLPAAEVLRIATWYTGFSFLGVARNAWVVSEGRQKYLKYIYGCAAVMNISLNFLLIPPLGARGAAAASLATQIGTSMLLPMLFRDMRPNVKLMTEAILLRNIR